MDANTLYIGPDEAADKYRLRRQIGGGGEAQLWEAEIEVGGDWEPVAVEILRHELFDDPTWRSQWSEQAEMLRFIRHAGVVGVREHFEGARMHRLGEREANGRAVYLTMNWVDGPTLREWLLNDQSQADGFEALRYLAQIADVLDWLHSGQATTSGRPVFHADVTPNNVIVRPVGQAVLVDFGLARLSARPNGGGGKADTGTSFGTAGFVAPELLAGGPVTAASDRYAFGALSYFVLTGETAPSDPVAIRERLAQLPALQAQPEKLGALMQMFDPLPEVRPSCASWIRLFRSAGLTTINTRGMAAPAPVPAGSGATETRRMPPPPSAPGATAGSEQNSKRRNPVALIAFLAVAAVLVGGIALALSRGGQNNVTDPTTVPSSAVPTSQAPTTPAPTTTVPQPTTTVPQPTTSVPRPTTTATSAPPSTAPTTTTVVSTTTAAPGPTAVPPDKFQFQSAGIRDVFVDGKKQKLAATNDSTYADPYSLGITLAPGASRLRGVIKAVDDVQPASASTKLTVQIDGVTVDEQDINLALPYTFDREVTGKRRVDFILGKWYSGGAIRHFAIALVGFEYGY